MKQVAVVGGGPGGLFTAYLLEQRHKDFCKVTLFESTPRVGGKILTRRFEPTDAIYEAGVAELYDYSSCGQDPLLRLVQKLGLKTIPMRGQTVVLDGRVLRNEREIGLYDKNVLQAIGTFRSSAARAMPLDEWYESNYHYDNTHPWTRLSCEDVLQKVADPTARKYLRVSVHSDLATEPHLTNGLNGLKNFLMDVPGYLQLYSVAGGIERIPISLARRLVATEVRTNSTVVRIEKNAKGTYGVLALSGDRHIREDFDAVFVAVPQSHLGNIHWGGERLSREMARFIAYYDRPGHYLRITLLFKNRFWRDMITDFWFILDSFGGCCVYDETARYTNGGHGVLGWLVAGSNALSMANLDDPSLIDSALHSLPPPLRKDARQFFVKGSVHRWLASVSAQPGGVPVRKTSATHVPEPKEHPGLFIVGDYLFDSTLNGVLDSAHVATDLFNSWLLKERLLHVGQNSEGSALRSSRHSAPAGEQADGTGDTRGRKLARLNGHTANRNYLASGNINHTYFDHYHEGQPYKDAFEEYFDARYVKDLIGLVWGVKPPYRLLDAGSASGLTLGELRSHGIDAWGVERNGYIHRQTPREVSRRNLLGDVRQLNFPDDHFDFVYETCLGYLPRRGVARAIRELGRVTKRGVIFASITSDMNPELFARSRLVFGMKTLMTLWEWGEAFIENGFRLAATDSGLLGKLWRCERKYNAGDDDWYPDANSLRYCFYSKVGK